MFLGGDLLPHPYDHNATVPADRFVADYIGLRLESLRRAMGTRYPRFFAILGNDDPGVESPACQALDDAGLWSYLHGRTAELAGHRVFGYACVPPTPFLLKDWERYDVSRYVPHGCVSPEEGHRSVPVDPHVIRFATIQDDLETLVGDTPTENALFLFHTPPHETALDRAGLDGRSVDGVPLDLNVGSIAVRRFIERRQPLVTMHGHIHESARITGRWRDRIGRTHMFSAAHDGPELALVRFDLDDLGRAQRDLL